MKPQHGPDDQGNVFRVMLNGRHVASFPTRECAERVIAGWMREWDGDFEIQERRVKTREHVDA